MSYFNRRSFIKKTAAAGAGAFLVPHFSIGKSGPSANSRLNIAFIGAGGIAYQCFGPVTKSGDNIVAICDVEETHFDLNAKKSPGISKAARFTDFRVMLDKMGDEIDAVCVSTPDHTHFVATMDAMQRGKHVFTQKPLTHNIWQARTLRAAQKKYGVTTVMGNQGHTFDGIRQMKEWYDAGVLGQVREVHSWREGPDWGNMYFKKPANYPPLKEAIPDTFDWDLWKGPVVTDREYNSIYAPLTWRTFFEFGGGMIGDWLVHICDGPVWTLDLYNPVVVEVVDQPESPKDFEPDYSVVRWDFAQRGSKIPCSLYWYEGGKVPELPKHYDWAQPDPETGKIPLPPAGGSFWYGDKQTGFTDERSNHPRLVNREDMKAFKESGYPDEQYARVEGGPVNEWLRALKGEGPEPGSNFDYASRLTEMALLGALAQRVGGRIEWDPEKGITNRPELNAYLKEPVRKGWEYGDEFSVFKGVI